MMRPRSSSRGRNTSASVTVTVDLGTAVMLSSPRTRLQSWVFVKNAETT